MVRAAEDDDRGLVRPVEADARGIVDPPAALQHFTLDRCAPSPPLDRFVDRFWVVTWDLPDGATHDQEVLTHPVVNLSVEPHGGEVHGVPTRKETTRLAGRGWALGTMYRPGGFRPFLGEPVATLTDHVCPGAAVLGAAFEATVAEVQASADASNHAALSAGALAAPVERFLTRLVPDARHPCEDVIEVAERIATDRTLTRVDQVAADAAVSVRTLQRLFTEHVGIGPKWVIQRYRLYDAAERVRHGQSVRWTELAAELGYSDQAHLTRHFTEAIGLPPERYARRCAESVG